METDGLLEQGMAALRAGDRALARRLLARAAREDTQSEQAWLRLSGAVENDKERFLCLSRVLAANPDNESARRGLAGLPQTQRGQLGYPPTQSAEAGSIAPSPPESAPVAQPRPVPSQRTITKRSSSAAGRACRRRQYGRMMIAGMLLALSAAGGAVATLAISRQLGDVRSAVYFGAIALGVASLLLGFSGWLANQARPRQNTPDSPGSR